MAATNPSGWSGLIKVKTSAGATADYPASLKSGTEQ